MVLIALLLVALVLVVLGVVLSSVGLLIASLAVSALAAALLIGSYLRTRRRGASPDGEPRAGPVRVAAPAATGEPTTAEAPAPRAHAGIESRRADTPPEAAAWQVWVADGYPEYHVEGCAELDGLPGEPVPYDQAVEDGFQPCVVCNPDRTLAREVTVVDGLPHYHVPGCERLLGSPSVSIPRQQAVTDGFTACAACRPDTAAAVIEPGGPGTGASGAAGERGSRVEVWVADGFPSFHRRGCPEIAEPTAEPIPYAQAVADGFTECPVCTPDHEPAEQAAVGALPADEGADVPGTVWVVDGLPDYHRETCHTLAGLPAEPIPRTQARDDGFTACPGCVPDGVVPSAADARDVWVVDGHPEYHRHGCDRLAGLDDEPVPHQQAVRDGFVPCRRCDPDELLGPGPVPGPEPVRDPEPAPEPGRSAGEPQPRQPDQV